MAHKNIFFKFVAVGVASFLLGSGASFLFAAWDNPTMAPTGGNVPAPLNVGDDVGGVPQKKLGGLELVRNLKVGGNAEMVGTAKVGKGLEVGGTAKVGGLLTVQGWNLGKDSAGGLFVSTGEEGQAPQRWMSNYTVIGPVPSNPAAKLVVNGTVQILGGGPAAGLVLTAGGSDGVASWQPALPAPSVNGHVLTADGSKAVWKALPPAGVTKIISGSGNVSVSSGGTGDVTISVERPYIPSVPDWVSNFSIPTPPGGGKILVSNSYGQASWQDPPSAPASAPSMSGQKCGGGTRLVGGYYVGANAQQHWNTWGCATGNDTPTAGCRQGATLRLTVGITLEDSTGFECLNN